MAEEEAVLGKDRRHALGAVSTLGFVGAGVSVIAVDRGFLK